MRAGPFVQGRFAGIKRDSKGRPGDETDKLHVTAAVPAPGHIRLADDASTCVEAKTAPQGQGSRHASCRGPYQEWQKESAILFSVHMTTNRE